MEGCEITQRDLEMVAIDETELLARSGISAWEASAERELHERFVFSRCVMGYVPIPSDRLIAMLAGEDGCRPGTDGADVELVDIEHKGVVLDSFGEPRRATTMVHALGETYIAGSDCSKDLASPAIEILTCCLNGCQPIVVWAASDREFTALDGVAPPE